MKNIGGRFFCQNMPFNPKSLKNLKKLIDKTDGRIVLTSSWRLSHDALVVLEARLAEYGIKIFDKTSKIYSSKNQRGQEISDWLNTFNQKCNVDVRRKGLVREAPILMKDILIIDDEDYDIKTIFEPMVIVKCNKYYGFNKKKYWEALAKYKKNNELSDLWIINKLSGSHYLN